MPDSGMSHATTAFSKTILQCTLEGGRRRDRQEEMLDGQRVHTPAHVRAAYKGLLQEKKKTGRGSLLNRSSCPRDDPIGQGSELN